jgi:hypothetical protein
VSNGTADLAKKVHAKLILALTLAKTDLAEPEELEGVAAP